MRMDLKLRTKAYKHLDQKEIKIYETKPNVF